MMTMLLAMVIQELSLPWAAWSVLRPDLLAIVMFYWRLYRPDRCTLWLVFLVGLLEDVMTHSPPGFNAFTNMIFILVVGRFGTRLRASDFLFLLTVLMALLAMEKMVQWSLMALQRQLLVHWPLFLGQPLATLLLAPLVTALLIRIHQSWMESANAGR
ncbi:MAG: rod shape-determining protein MreD [Magnetococcales bacterium]|nr:rod shape-determining protein MreD [Magnetococcales bacterium]NGZ25340.1 rod shape-determining protein MreD [Magnetococcales bacterium]